MNRVRITLLSAINTEASEIRASLSTDGTRLHFGRKLDANDPGDVFVAKRALIASRAMQSAPGIGAPMRVPLAALLAGAAWRAWRVGTNGGLLG